MKKLLAVMMALVMVFAFCVPSFAETTTAVEESGFFDTIISTVSGILGEYLPTDESGNISASDILGTIAGIVGGIGGGSDTTEDPTGSTEDSSLSDLPNIENLSPEMAKVVVNVLLQEATKEEAAAAIEELYAAGKIDDVSYQNLLAALEAADESSSTPDINDEDVTAAATEIINALKQMGVSDSQLKSVVDALYERGTIPQNVYDEIIRQLDAAETTTEASNEGGIGGFLSGIVDAITGLFGGGGDDTTTGGDGSSTTTNPDEYAGTEPTGDTAILSVAAVAAVAGVALVLTKKKQK